MKAIATNGASAFDPECHRGVTVFADDAGEYCTWFFGEHPPNLLGSEMDLPYRVDRVMARFLPRNGFSVAEYIRQLSRWLLLTYEAHNFEVTPEEWVGAA